MKEWTNGSMASHRLAEVLRLGLRTVLVAALPVVSQAQTPTPTPAPAPEPGPTQTPTPTQMQTQTQATEQSQAPPPSWNFSGDFRLRWERTSDQEVTAAPDILDPRRRWVVRTRSDRTRQFGKVTNFGVRIATGQRGDPNSTDITLGDFADRLEMSFDRAYLELKGKRAFVTGGKFANPFTTSELVWDGDVNPQGVAGSIA